MTPAICNLMQGSSWGLHWWRLSGLNRYVNAVAYTLRAMSARERQSICQNPEVAASLADLERWFSVPRMETFSHQKNPVDLYLWNAQLAKAFLEDIEHFEVLLRNWIDRHVTKAWGEKWYDNINSVLNPTGLNFNSIDRRAISKAERRAGCRMRFVGTGVPGTPTTRTHGTNCPKSTREKWIRLRGV